MLHGRSNMMDSFPGPEQTSRTGSPEALGLIWGQNMKGAFSQQHPLLTWEWAPKGLGTNWSWNASKLWLKLNLKVFPGSSVGKESACNVGDLGPISVLGRLPGGGHGYPLQYSCLENSHGWRSLAGYSPWGRKELDTTEKLSVPTCTHTHVHWWTLRLFPCIGYCKYAAKSFLWINSQKWNCWVIW